MARSLDESWLGWVKTNVDRGCSKDEMAQILAREGFGADDIRAAFERAGTSAPVIVAPAPIVGAARATLAIANAKRFESAAIELYTAEGFLDARECAELVRLVKAELRPSTISTPQSGEPDQYFRTSSTCDLRADHPEIRALDAKVATALGVDPACAEVSQGQLYEVGQEFKAHTDFFKDYELERYSTATLGQRTWTFMIYLNEPGGGGETRFVDVGLSVKPRLGMAVIWNNLLATGAGNNFTRHQGMPVTEGTKVIITKWFRMPRGGQARAYASLPVSWKQGPRP